MGNTVLRCVSVVCITAFSSLLLYFEHPYLAIFTEIMGLAIIFDALDTLSDLF